MTPKTGDLYTVTPHRMHDGSTCGRWHGRITSDVVLDGNRIFVQELRIRDSRFKPAMTTAVPISALVPLEVQVDLFGQLDTRQQGLAA